MSRLAKADGYELVFTGLNGSDHYTEDDYMGRRLGLRCESLITSDVTRSSPLLQDGQKEPKKLNGCKNWRKILPAKSVSNGRVSCWACWKFQMLCPELVGEGAANILNFSGLGGIAREILQRCHDSDGVVRWCQRDDGIGCVWFFPSGRIYPHDERRFAVSSTRIRSILDQVPRHKLYGAIGGIALNLEKLLKMLGLIQEPGAEDSNLVGEDGFNDSLRGKGRDYQEFKLKIKALSQEEGQGGPATLPGKSKDDTHLGQAETS